MSSLGNQWRVIRHYLSLTNLNTEVEKLIQKLKPVTPEQWENLITRFEKSVSTRFITGMKDVETAKVQEIPNANANNNTVKATTIEKDASSKSETEKQIVEEKPSETALGNETKDTLSIEGLLQGLKLKKDLHFGKISEPSWKDNKPTVSKTSIHSRTAYVISAIVSAESQECLYHRVEHFVEHLLQYPESKDYAIKEGGIRALLRVQSKLSGDDGLVKELKGAVNEALALLGYTGPTKGPGPNILAIDGGGIRGIIAIEILRHLERLTGKKVSDMFDLIVGVSTGAIIASVIGSGIGNLDTASDMYHTLSKKMFGNTSIIGGTSRLVWSQSYYDTEAWEKMLQDHLGDRTMTQCNRHHNLKLAVVSCAATGPGGGLAPFVFRSYGGRRRVRAALPGAAAARVWHAVRASAAAPTYFNEFIHTNRNHQDGGIMVNNPTGVAIHEAKVLFGPDELRKGCIVSVGTGKALNKHWDYQLMRDVPATGPAGTTWKDKFNMILDSATDTEGVHLLVNDLLPSGSYYRFNPPLLQECAMDEIDPRRLNGLVSDTAAYIRRNQHKFSQAATMLSRKRSIAQRIGDYIERQSLIMGVVAAK